MKAANVSERFRLSRRRALGLAAATGGAAAVATACGRSSGSKSSSVTQSQAGPTAKPRSGGQFSVAMSADISNLDPSGNPSNNKAAMRAAYDALMTIKTGPGLNPTDITLAPALADRWEAPDGQTFTFHLHQGAKFADLPPVNGREMTSADVQWSFEYLARTGPLAGVKGLGPSMNSWMFDGMTGIETPDPNTVQVKFGAPYVPFLSYMAQFWSTIVAHEIYDRDGNFSKTIVGTGPWQLDTASTQHGSRWVFKKNPTYFKQGLPYIDQLNWLVISDTSTGNAAFQTKQLDLLGADRSAVRGSTVDQVSKANPGAVKLTCPASRGGMLYINVSKPPLNDLRVRKAINLSINRDEFAKLEGEADPLWSAVGETPGLFTQTELKQMLKFDPAQAKQMVTQAGYPNGVDVEIIAHVSNDSDKSALQLLIAQAKAGGVNLTYNPVDVATVGKKTKSHDFLLDFSAGGENIEIDDALYSNFFSKSAKNYGLVNDPDLDKLILAQRQETDAEKRKQIARQAVQRIYDQSWSASFIFPTVYQFTQSYVKNYAPNTFVRDLSILETWLDK